MTIKNARMGLLLVVSVFFMAVSCRKNEAPLPDNTIQFESNEQGLTETASEIIINVKLSRATDRDIPVTVSLTNTGLDYGDDYTTSPEVSSGVLVLTVLSGSRETSFTIKKKAGILFSGEEKISFKIVSSGTPVIIGTASDFILKFHELVSVSSSITGDGGGATYGNKIYFDLSSNMLTGVLRTKWDLGFYAGSDDFRVILNSSTAMMAKQIPKNDLNAVTAADTIGFSTDVIFNQAAPTTQSLNYIDYPDGDLAKTAIATISVTADENKVYIINRGKGIGNPAPDRGWKKIRILRNATGGYTLQQADINASAFTTVEIPKNNSYFFNYLSFENGAVDIEPAKGKWDLAWTYFSNATDFGGGEVPYTFQDVILQNRNVQAAKVLSNVISYESFAEENLAAQNFQTSQRAIGADWRSGGGPSSAPSVRSDRFYVIKDADENYYKIRFTAMTQNGERGYPAFEYALVKRGVQ